MAIASVSASTSDASSLSGAGKAKSTAGNPFQELLDLLANLNSGQPVSGADLQKLTQLEGNNGSQTQTAADGSKDNNASADSGNGGLTAAQISQLAALMQQNPQLQAVLSGNINVQSLFEVTNILAKGGQPDWSQYDLPPSAQDMLQQMASQPGQLTSMQKLLADMQNNADGTAELNDLADLTQQLNLQANPATNAAPPAAVQTQTLVQVVPVPAQVSVQVADPSVLKPKVQLSGNAAILADADLSSQNHIAQPPAAAGQSNKSAADDRADQSADAQDGAATAAADKPTVNDNFTAVVEKAVSSSDIAPMPADMLAAAQAANSAAVMTPQLNDTAGQQVNQANVINASAAQFYNTLQAANSPAALPPAVMQAAMQIQQNAQMANNNNFMVQLYPAELGQIQVNLKFEGNKVTARITADKETTLAMMKEDSGELHKALQNAGLQTDSNTLEFSLSNSAQNMAQQKNNSGNGSFGTMLANNNTEELNPQSLAQANNILATGRVDVKL